MGIIEAISSIVDLIGKPGVLGLKGRRIERRTQAGLAAYFRGLAKAINVESLASMAGTQHGEHAKPLIPHLVETVLAEPLRTYRSQLLGALAVGIQAAYLAGSDIHPFAGANHRAQDATLTVEPPAQLPDDDDQPIDKLGPTGQAASDWAAQYSARLVSQLEATTQSKIADIISTGIEDQLGVDGTARLIRQLLADMSVTRARLIASTEINAAMSKATLDKLKRLQVEYKQLITDTDACPICQSIADAGPVSVDDPFVDDEGEEYDSTPIHPGCRCATTGARAPETGSIGGFHG